MLADRFRAAAERIDNGTEEACCPALRGGCPANQWPMPFDCDCNRVEPFFASYFEPEEHEAGAWWWARGLKQERVLALLFAAAIAESEAA